MAEERSGKKASTEGRLREVGSARNSVAESVAFAIASSGVAIVTGYREPPVARREVRNVEI